MAINKSRTLGKDDRASFAERCQWTNRNPEEMYLEHELVGDLYRALDELPEDTRHIVVYRAMLRQSWLVVVAACPTKMSVRTARKRLNQGLDHLKQRLR